MSLLENKNFAFSTLAAGVAIDASSLTVTSGHGTLFPSTGEFMCAIWGSAYASPGLDADRELVKMTLTTGDTFAIDRASEGTSASAWSSGDNVALVLTAGKLTELEEAIQDGSLSYAIATGTNTYSAVLDPILAAYVDGLAVNIKFTNANTAASTLALNSLTAKSIYKSSGGVYTPIVSGDIIAGLYSTLFYNSSLDSSAGGWVLVTPEPADQSEFASGTAMLFPQAAAPTGWTADTSWTNIRSIMVGNAYATGGTHAGNSFTTSVQVSDHIAHAHTGPSHTHNIAVAGHTLTINEIPAHAHTGAVNRVTYYYGGGRLDVSGYNAGTYTSYTGGGAAHNHTATASASGTGYTGYGNVSAHSVLQCTYAPRYMTVLRAIKD